MTPGVSDRRQVLGGVFAGIASRPAAQLSFAAFGAIGDGVADDTQALNRALRASAQTGQPVRGKLGAAYRVTPSGQKSFFNPDGGKISKLFCVEMPSKAAVDFSGSTIISNGQTEAVAFTNENHLGGDVLNISGLVVEGAKANGRVPLVWIGGCRDSVFSSMSVRRASHVGLCITRAENSRFGELRADDVVGNAIILGGNDFHQVRRCTIRNIVVHNTRSFDQPHTPGNAVVIGAVDMLVGSIEAHNCSGGSKITANANNIRIGTSLFEGGSTLNGGLKLQGDDGAPCHHIYVGAAISRNCLGAGLYLRNAIACTVQQYHGDHNGRSGNDPDVWLDADQFSGGDFVIVEPGSAAFMGRPTCGSFAIAHLLVQQARTSNRPAVVLMGGKGRIAALSGGKVWAAPSAHVDITTQ